MYPLRARACVATGDLQLNQIKRASMNGCCDLMRSEAGMPAGRLQGSAPDNDTHANAVTAEHLTNVVRDIAAIGVDHGRGGQPRDDRCAEDPQAGPTTQVCASGSLCRSDPWKESLGE
jgi:hypothetical protein